MILARLIIIVCSLFILTNLKAQSPKKVKKQADSDFNTNRYQEAVIGYTKLLELKPNNFSILNKRAACYELLNQPKNAINDYIVSNKLKYKNKNIYLKLADLYMLINDYENANAVLNRLLNYDKWHIEGLQKAALCNIMLKKFHESESFAYRAIDREKNGKGPTSEVSHFYKAIALDSLRDYSAAIFSYSRAIYILKQRKENRIKPLPKYKSYYFNIAKAYCNNKLYDESIKNYNISASVDEKDEVTSPKNYEVYYYRSFPYLAKTDFNNSIGDLNKAIVLSPKNAKLFFQRGLVYKQTSQFQSAISDFSKAIILDDSLILAYLYKAQCLMELNNFSEAISEALKCLNLSPNNAEALSILKEAQYKNYNANKENDAPNIKWSYPFIDQNNFINVYSNQLNVSLEGDITDKSFLKSIIVNNNEMLFKKGELNPSYSFKIPADNLKKIEMVVTDIYNNVSKKTVKVGKIVSDTRLIVNLEGIILANDSSLAPLINKTVTLTNQKGEHFFVTKTDSKGYFKYKNLPLDKDYLIEIEDDSNELNLKNKGFLLADEKGKVILKSIKNGNNKFCFELLKSDLLTLNLMDIDDLDIMINISGKLLANTAGKEPIANINMQLIKTSGDILTKKTDINGNFSFNALNPNENYSFKIDEAESSKINVNSVLITDNNGQVLKTINKSNIGNFEYRLLEIEKTQLSEITEPDPWLKITSLNRDKKELEIIENIYYESGSFTLPEKAFDVLNKAIEALKNNIKLSLQIQSHTDAVSNDDFNLELSQKRATKVADYIILKGIDKKRIVAIGMGEKLIINQCVNAVDCSDAEHKQNRRTVFKLIYN